VRLSVDDLTRRLAFVEPAADFGRPAASEEFPFLLAAGKANTFWHQNNVMKKTQIPRREYNALLLLYPKGFVEIAAEDAAALGVRDRGAVAVVSAGGSMKVAARVSGDIRPGTAYVPYFIGEMVPGFLDAQVVLDEDQDSVIPVRVERLDHVSPPRTNPSSWSPPCPRPRSLRPVQDPRSGELLFDRSLTGPGRLDAAIPYNPPKAAVFPQAERIASYGYDRETRRVEISGRTSSVRRPSSGRSCDLTGSSASTGSISARNTWTKSTGTTEKAVHCRQYRVRPFPQCFCVCTDSGPAAREGFDVSLTEAGGDYLFETGSDMGAARPAGWG
jgi:formylmethanofuran dehydrogenase subunit D